MRMFADYSYFGLLDDFAARHSDAAISTLEELNKQLVTAVLFEGPILINDGYILFHPTIKEALLNPEKSPLKTLIECGFVKILSRNGGFLGDLANRMADENITSAIDLMKQQSFLSDYQPFLSRWSERLSSSAYNASTPWPKFHLDRVFQSVSQVALSSESLSQAIDDNDLEIFKEKLAGSKQRRTEWENIANSLLSAEKISKKSHISIMHAANEAYQYSWGCALSVTHNGARVLTRTPRHLDSLEQPEITLGRALGKPINIGVPDAAFAIDATKRDWGKLKDVVAIGRDLNWLKHEYLKSVAQYYGGSLTSQKELDSSASNYTTALSKHFGSEKCASFIFDITLFSTGTVLGAALAGPLGASIGAAISIAGMAGTHYEVPKKLLWRLTSPDPAKWIDKKYNSTAADISCFSIDVSSAMAHTNGHERNI